MAAAKEVLTESESASKLVMELECGMVDEWADSLVGRRAVWTDDE